MKLIRTILTRLLDNRASTLAGLGLIAFALILYFFERIKMNSTVDSSIFIGMLTLGAGLLAAKDPKGHA